MVLVFREILTKMMWKKEESELVPSSALLRLLMPSYEMNRGTKVTNAYIHVKTKVWNDPLND